jgi:hypothetical protein
MDFQEFQNSIVEAVAEKVKNTKKKRELSPEEKERRRKVLAENVKRSKEKKTKEPKYTPSLQVQEMLEPTRVEAVMPSMPVQPDFDLYFKQINERFDRFENQFNEKIKQPIQSLNTSVPKQTPRVVKQVPKVQKQAVQKPAVPTPKQEPPKQKPEKVTVYSAFKSNPWLQGPF